MCVFDMLATTLDTELDAKSKFQSPSETKIPLKKSES